MIARNKIASLLGGAAMIAGVVAMTAGLVPAAAAPKQIGATMNIVGDPTYPENYLIAVGGVYPMSQADAQGFLNNINNGKCEGALFYHVSADDDNGNGNGNGNGIHSALYRKEHSDIRGHWKASSGSLQYRREFTLPKSKFNEDDGVFDDTDEIHSQVSFVDSDCNTRVHTSNVVSRVL